MIAKRIKRLVKSEAFVRSKSLEVIDVTQTLAIISLVPAIALAIVTQLNLLDFLEKTILVRFVEPAVIGLITPASVFISVPIVAILTLLIGGLILHLFAMVFGAKKKYVDTVNALAAGMTPCLLFGWIPFINVWAGVYSLMILVRGLSGKQKLTLARSTAAVALPLIILAIVALYYTIPVLSEIGIGALT